MAIQQGQRPQHGMTVASVHDHRVGFGLSSRDLAAERRDVGDDAKSKRLKVWIWDWGLDLGRQKMNQSDILRSRFQER